MRAGHFFRGPWASGLRRHLPCSNILMTGTPVSAQPEPLAAHVEETVRSIALLRAKHHKGASIAQHHVDRATALAGRPSFLGLISCTTALWIGANSALSYLGLQTIDPPPFAWLELTATVTALLMAVLILVTQRSASRLAEVRGEMTLELALLTEQKTTKLIELVEELRRDTPQVRDRLDSEADEMSIRTDPHALHVAVQEANGEMCAAIDEESASTAISVTTPSQKGRDVKLPESKSCPSDLNTAKPPIELLTSDELESEMYCP